MNLDEQLRATLSHEAEVRNAPPLDLDTLISGGRVRRRRRTAARLGIGVLAAVLVGGAAFSLTQPGPWNRGAEPGIANQTTEPSEAAQTTSALQDGNRRPVAPGTYRVFVGVDATGERIEADMTVDGTGWASGDNPVVFDGGHAAGVGIYRPEVVATVSGCEGDWQGWTAAKTPLGLARQLARLPLGTLVQPPTPTEVLGHDGLHLRVRIDPECPGDLGYSVVLTALGNRGISYSQVPATDVVIDFWVVDVDGTRVVVDVWHDIDAPQALVDRASRARESISLIPAE